MTLRHSWKLGVCQLAANLESANIMGKSSIPLKRILCMFINDMNLSSYHVVG